MNLELNPEQRAAVEHEEGPLLILAGAGSGKTRVLTVRVARLIEEQGIPPERILAVTFTNKAAEEMRSRVAALLGRDARGLGLWIGTFHSVAARILRREARYAERDRAFSIYDEEDALRTLKAAMEEVGLDPKRWTPRVLRSRISQAKNALIGPGEYRAAEFDLLGRAVADLYPAYQRLLVARNAYDFDDLLFESVRLLEEKSSVRERWESRFLHVLVDEYQDTNHAQYRLVRVLGRAHGNVCVVGDDDQSIYGWRGADVRNILDFERDFPGARVVRLEENYRSTAAILEVANAVIAHNRNRKPKRLRTRRAGGDPIRVIQAPDERAEARWTIREIRSLSDTYGPGDCAVLYRTNAQSRAYEEALRAADLPYRIVGGVRFYERREVKDVIAYLQLLANPADVAAFERAVGWPRRGVGAVTLERLRALASETGRTPLELAREAGDLAGISPPAARSLMVFASEIEGVAESLPYASPRAIVEECVSRFRLAAALQEEEDGDERLANVAELVAAAAAFDREEVEEPDSQASDLELFLQSISLRSEIDEVELGEEAVTLMTLHNAKGLEFPVVFVGGLEDGLFPLARAYDAEEEFEEERRLFYVGVTRARDRLYLTFADRRWRAGLASPSAPSPFLEELPREGVRWVRVGGRGSRSQPGVPATDFSWRRSFDRAAAPRRAPEEAAGTPGARTQETGRRYDYSDTQVPLVLEPGSRIVHPLFGEGRILSVSGRGPGAKAEIDFASVGRKKVVLEYAGLRPA